MKELNLTATEQTALNRSPFDAIYPPAEKIPAIVVENFPALGTLAAMRFIEWVQANPGGVISLPTGKSPEHFIGWVNRLLAGWHTKEVHKILENAGIDPAVHPDMKSLHFVQIDEFYPIDPAQENSFYHYVNEYYIRGFGLDPAKASLINASRIALAPGETLLSIWQNQPVDLTLRYRHPKTNLESRQKDILARLDQWCMDYEDHIRSLGGLGFFLGGIGPDGHIGFNISGSDHNSTTRLCPVNYETQAAAAGDLGGIETARHSLVITVGLRTITGNPDCTAIIIAAGEAKAPIVARAIQSDPCIDVPATALQKLPNARFYITRGAAIHLKDRQASLLRHSQQMTDEHAESILVDLAVSRYKQLTALTPEDFASDPGAALLLERRTESHSQLARMVRDRLIAKIERGIPTAGDKCFLHTEPHHDDIMLGYFAHVARHFRQPGNTHHFISLTSGFTAVTNAFMQTQLLNLRAFLRSPDFARLMPEDYFRPDDRFARNRDIWQYLDGVAANDEHEKSEGLARRTLRNLFEVFADASLDAVDTRISELLDYFASAYPGKKDPPRIQQLKGMSREWESECLWGYFGWQCDNVRHLRLAFYTGDVFTREPSLSQDVPPIVDVIKSVKPDVLTVAFDPEASGPDTHYKVMQATAEALKIYLRDAANPNIEIWGYRNVWYRFATREANVFVPVSLNMFTIMHQAFLNAYITQRDASFPSHEHDGPFSELAQRIQVAQYNRIKTCLGRQWFHNHPSPLIRATRGLAFLKVMTPDEFFDSCRRLRKSVESH
jgi:glucosamine-6-phosphate deaminase